MQMISEVCLLMAYERQMIPTLVSKVSLKVVLFCRG